MAAAVMHLLVNDKEALNKLNELQEQRDFWFAVFTRARQGMLITKMVLFNLACLLALYVLHYWFNDETGYGFYNVATVMSLVNIFGLEIGKDFLQTYSYSRHLLFEQTESTTTKLICFSTMFFPDLLAAANLYFVYLMADEYQPMIVIGSVVYFCPIVAEYLMALHIYRLTKKLEAINNRITAAA